VGWVDAHLIPAKFSDHRADVLLELSEVIKICPLVGCADEAHPTDEWVVESASAKESCSTSVVNPSVNVDAFSDRVNRDDVAGKFSQRASWKAAVKFGGVMDEKCGDLIEVLTFANANQCSVSLDTADD